VVRGYDWPWAQYSRQFRQAHPVCGERADGTLDAIHSRCVQLGLTTPAECVDHTMPLSQGGSKWDPANHMAACQACNLWKANTLEQNMAMVRTR
jgi:5-methylcytosine-specific restriction endonuclease McrA